MQSQKCESIRRKRQALPVQALQSACGFLLCSFFSFQEKKLCFSPKKSKAAFTSELAFRMSLQSRFTPF